MTQTVKSSASTSASPTTSRSPCTPTTPTPTTATTPTRSRTHTSDVSELRVDQTTAAFRILDKLVELSPDEAEKFPIPLVVVVGAQSVGKSSLLSMICDVPLWCAEVTSTFGPTHIHSRRRDGEFSAQVWIKLASPAEGAPHRMLFTEHPLRTKGDLQKVLKLAGQEASHAGDRLVLSRTYEALSTGRAKHNRGEADLNQNIVQVMVSSPEQPDLSIIDLPGLVSGKGDAVSAALADQYLSKPESIVLLCLAAGAGDPQSDSPEMKLLLRHDPRLERTMVIVTKPDQIWQPTKSSWGKVISGTNENFTHNEVPLIPALGVHPVRSRTAEEYDRGVGTAAIVAAGRHLFNGRGWQVLAQGLGRKFGWEETRAVLDKNYKTLVKKNVPKLRRQLTATQAQLVADEKQYPPQVANPVQELHEVIERFHEELKVQLTERGDTTDVFVGLQENFEKELLSSVPKFVARENPAAAAAADNDHAPVELAGRNLIYLDDVNKTFYMYRNAHDGVVEHAARSAFICELVQKWEAQCHAYNKAYWAALHELVEKVALAICRDKPQVGQLIINELQQVSQPIHSEISAFISGRVVAEKAPREHVELLPTPDHMEAVRRITATNLAEFAQVYKTDIPEGTGGFAGLRSHPGAGTSPDKWSPDYIVRVIRFAAEVEILVRQSADRLKNAIGRELPLSVKHTFLPRVTAHLREVMNLNVVQDHVHKRAVSLCEPDEEMVEKREKIKKRRLAIEHLQGVLDRHAS